MIELSLPEVVSPPIAVDLPRDMPAEPPLASPLPAPAASADDHYLVIAHHRAGNYAPEREEADLVSRERTVRDIYEGQIEEVARVIAFDPAWGTCRDATAEIASDVAGLHVSEQTEPHWRRRDWLHRVLGIAQTDLILGVRR